MIRESGPDDREAVRRVVLAAFGPDEGPAVAGLTEALVEAGHARLGE